MNSLRYIIRNTVYIPKPYQDVIFRSCSSNEKTQPKFTPRMEAFKKKLEESFPDVQKPKGREITPIRKLDQKNLEHPKEFQYEPFPDNTNPITGEIGGPRGPEPTRYGDWERKGRCTDF